MVIIFAFKSMSKQNLVWSIKYKSHQIEIKSNFDFTVNPPTGGGKLLVDEREVPSWELTYHYQTNHLSRFRYF